MDNNTQLKLEELQKKFNSEINSLSQDKNFQSKIQELINQYIKDLNTIFQEQNIKSYSVTEYAVSQFKVLINDFQKYTNTHGTILTNDFIQNNRREFKRAIETLNDNNLNREQKENKVSQASHSKMMSLSDAQTHQTSADERKLKQLSRELSLLADELASHTTRILTSGLGNRDYVQISKIEAKAIKISKQLKSSLNRSFIDKCNETMRDHITSICAEISEKNDTYLMQFKKYVFSEKEISDSSNPFELPDQYKKAVVDVGKKPTTKKPENTPTMELPRDILI